MMIGKLIGKALGEVVVAPVTVAAEALKAGEATIDHAGEALGRAAEAFEGTVEGRRP